MKSIEPKVNSYDKRSGKYVDMGENHGVGKAPPKSSSGNPSKAPAMPKKAKVKNGKC